MIALLKKLIKEAICKHEYAVLTEIENAAPYKSGVFVRVFVCGCGKCGKTTFKVIG